MPRILARSLEQIAAQFGRLSADHTRDMDTLRHGPMLLQRYHQHATEAGRLILEIRGDYGDGRNQDRDPLDPRHVAGVSPKVLGRNVRRGFKWEDDYDRGSDDHARVLWGRGVIGEWMPIRTPEQFGSDAKTHWQLVGRTSKSRGAELLAAAMTMMKNSRDACDAMKTILLDGLRDGEPGFSIARARSTFIFGPLQRDIWKALEHRALKKQALADEVCAGEGTRLYKTNGIKEMMRDGIVARKHGVGYYRPDAPPPELVCELKPH